MPVDIPPCPRCDYHDGGGDLCYNGSTITYRCYECNYIWIADAPETYLGDDARLDACKGIYAPRKDNDDA